MNECIKLLHQDKWRRRKREKRKGKEIKTDSDIEYVKESNNYLADFLQRSIEFGDGSGGPEKYSLWYTRGE